MLEHLGKRVLVFLGCVSFANLFFLDEWDKLASRWADAALTSPPNPTLAQFFGPVLIALLGLAIAFRIVVAIAPRLYRWLALAALLAPLNLLRMDAVHLERQDLIRLLGRAGAIAVVALLLIIMVAALIRWSARLLRLPATVALVLAPLLPIQLVYNFWRFEHLPPPSAYMDQPSAPSDRDFGEPPATSKDNTRRVICLLFDELDQSLVFDHRPASVQLPEFDRLRRESVYADHAKAPGLYTMEAVPGMLTGRYVERARELGPGNLLLKFADDPKAKRWSEVRNLFDDLRDKGVNSAVLGAELPYCRAIGHSLASCDWFPSGTVDIALKRPSILDRAWYLLRTRPFAFPWLSSTRYFRAPLFDEETRRRSRAAEAASFELMRHRAGELAVDTRFQLVFMHFPVPHLLGIYDRRTHDYTTSDATSYVDNLALADRTLGDVRRALEGAQLWDDTIVLVTSDHPLRDWIIEDAGWWNDRETASLGSIPRRYVPSLLKFPHRPPEELHEPTNGLLIHDTLLNLLSVAPHI